MFLLKIIPKSTFEIIILIIAGLMIFMLGLNNTKYNLKKLTSSKLKNMINKHLKTRFNTFFIGIIASIILQSSSAVTAIVISFMASNYLSLPQGLGIMIGSNLGTCITAFIFGINMEEYSFIIISIASIIIFSTKKSKKLCIANIFLGIGFIFLGLQLMNSGLNSFSEKANIANSIKKYSTYISLSFLFGTLSSFIIQSSSAIIAILESLYANNLLSLTSSIAIILGANVGTTITGIFTLPDTTKDCHTAILANVLFNIIGAFLFLIFINLFTSFIMLFSSLEPKILIALTQTLFNLISVILAYIFFNKLLKLTNYIQDKLTIKKNVL